MTEGFAQAGWRRVHRVKEYKQIYIHWKETAPFTKAELPFLNCPDSANSIAQRYVLTNDWSMI